VASHWRREEFLRICSKKDLTEKAQDIDVTIPVQKSQETRYSFDPVSFFENHIWGRWPDGVAVNEALQIVYVVEFKRSTDRDEGFVKVEKAEANEQYKSIISALRAAAPKWKCEQINFVVGNCRLVVDSNMLNKLDSQEGKKDKKITDHVTQVCQAHNRVIVSCLQQVQGLRFASSTTEGSTRGEQLAQSARERRRTEKHTLIERQNWGPSNDDGL